MYIHTYLYVTAFYCLCHERRHIIVIYRPNKIYIISLKKKNSIECETKLSTIQIQLYVCIFLFKNKGNCIPNTMKAPRYNIHGK